MRSIPLQDTERPPLLRRRFWLPSQGPPALAAPPSPLLLGPPAVRGPPPPSRCGLPSSLVRGVGAVLRGGFGVAPVRVSLSPPSHDSSAHGWNRTNDTSFRKRVL